MNLLSFAKSSHNNIIIKSESGDLVSFIKKIQTQRRKKYNKPHPSFEGTCSGSSKEKRSCNKGPCHEGNTRGGIIW